MASISLTANETYDTRQHFDSQMMRLIWIEFFDEQRRVREPNRKVSLRYGHLPFFHREPDFRWMTSHFVSPVSVK